MDMQAEITMAANVANGCQKEANGGRQVFRKYFNRNYLRGRRKAVSQKKTYQILKHGS